MLPKRRQSLPIMQHPISAILFPGYRRRVLGLLLLHPDEALHGREIARRTGLPSGTITRELVRLADAGLLSRSQRGNQVLYGANRASPVFEELASILRKTSGLADVLAEALSTAKASIDVSFVYGSIARGKEVAGSDIDVMVIGKAKFGEIARLLHPAQATLGREINPKVFQAAEWRKAVAAKDPFVTDVLGKPKVLLIGTADELAELGGRKPRARRAVG
jgi:predicted nucleotidyltransferase